MRSPGINGRVFKCTLLLYLLPTGSCHRLKTVEMVIRNTQGAEGVLKQYEDCLREVHTVPSSVKEVETYKTKLKVSGICRGFGYLDPSRRFTWPAFLRYTQKMRTEAEAEQPVFDSLEEELRKASAVSNKMAKVHSERDVELDRYRLLLSNLQDRWKAVFTQIDLRQRDLELLGRQLGQYRESYDWLIRWIADAKQRQEKIQAVPITDSKTLKEQLAQETVGWSQWLQPKPESSTLVLDTCNVAPSLVLTETVG